MGKTVISFIILILGIYYIFNHKPIDEGFDSEEPKKTSVEGNLDQIATTNALTFSFKRKYFHLHNTAKVPSINPLKFDSLEEYTEFIECNAVGINAYSILAPKLRRTRKSHLQH